MTELTRDQARNIARILWGARQRRLREEAVRHVEQESIAAPLPPEGKATDA